MKTLPTYFISHGGGPWPWMKKERPGLYDKLEASLASMPAEMGETPRAILMISGHWEENDFTVMTTPHPGMIYDYGGFPEHTYHIHYSAPGAPEVAQRIVELFQKSGITLKQNSTRGFDHGVYSPMRAIYPDANVPVLQLSLKKTLDPAEHIKAGRALAPLRDENVLIVGSGLSYHNLRNFGSGARAASLNFDLWLQETLLKLPPAEREATLVRWSEAPSARDAHPREDHLIPLMVAVGAANQDTATCVYHESEFMNGISVSSFRFG